jgi:catechol 2,3-dioxygenase-like lactoylglutathione lyase family enzyme
MKRITHFLSAFFLLFSVNLKAQDVQVLKLPFSSNAYTLPKAVNEEALITDSGLLGWTNPNTVTKVYFYTAKPTSANIFLDLDQVFDACQLSIKLDGKSRSHIIKISNNEFKVPIGNFEFKDSGYHYFEIKGASHKGIKYPTIKSLVFEKFSKDAIKFNTSNYRGAASTHLRYTVPGDSAVKWFYTEVMVPNEVQHSVNAYYETNGFHSGYGGIQINSTTERRFIFSIWSLFKTDDPKQIPLDYIVRLNKKGKNVFTGDFGDEGSGGHSHLVYPWKTNTTYRFLTGIIDLKGDSATYIGYYASPDDNYKWHLLSKWTQHKTDTKTGFKRLYAFVENFGDNGDDYFKAFYSNQWVVTFNGTWMELTEAKFTTTANNKTHQRFDYGAGVENGNFYMFSGGFKKKRNIMPGDVITRPATGKHVEIDFEGLDK